MNVIWKYALELRDEQVLMLPEGGSILTVQMQGEVICLWAVVNPKAREIPVKFMIVGTGNHGPNFEGLAYVGTVQERQFVWHVFVEPRAKKAAEVTP